MGVNFLAGVKMSQKMQNICEFGRHGVGHGGRHGGKQGGRQGCRHGGRHGGGHGGRHVQNQVYKALNVLKQSVLGRGCMKRSVADLHVF